MEKHPQPELKQIEDSHSTHDGFDAASLQFGVHEHDARDLNDVVAPSTVDVTITSPPYFDLKNYGHKDQIGFGQSYEEYLDDLSAVFEKVYSATKETGSLWVIIDMFKRDGEVIPLPFDFVERIKKIGWKLQEVIIWEKDRTVPWAHTGQMRNAFEYILVFAKSGKPKFFIDRVKNITSLKKWWVRYPERYNPKGKSPAAIWSFGIPTQGSWGNGYIRHFCPLPEELISQILQITTDEGDVVLDPFAGSGAVLARAAAMKRHYVGCELNQTYIKMFKDYLEKTHASKLATYEASKTGSLTEKTFEELIINLRVLKFARVVYGSLSRTEQDAILKLFVLDSGTRSDTAHKLRRVKYHVLVKAEKAEKIKKAIAELVDVPPLSKFGIESEFQFHTSLASFLDQVSMRRRLFVYSARVTHRVKKKFVSSQLAAAPKDDLIISGIEVNVDEKLYD